MFLLIPKKSFCSELDVVELLHCITRTPLAYLNDVKFHFYQFVQKITIQNIRILNIESNFSFDNIRLFVGFKLECSTLW